MNKLTILNHFRKQLAEQAYESSSRTAEALNISPWVAMSLLQKAIRRAEGDLAQRAAATLLKLAPERLWRRLGVVAFEDIGVADLETVALVTASLAGKRFRTTIGGEWLVASFVVARMASAPQCRAADDLLLAAESHPTYQRARRDLANKNLGELIRIAAGSAALPVRALAAWFAIGTDRRPSFHLLKRQGDPTAYFDGMCEAGLPHTVVETAREGFRKVGEVLCPFVSLLCPMRQLEQTVLKSDEFPPEVMIGEVPGWAYDIYTREGRAAYQSFLTGNSDSARWVCAHVPKARRLDFLGTAVFRVEGGLVRNRLRWSTGNELRRLVDVECHGPECPDATEFLELLKADISNVNEARLSHVG